MDWFDLHENICVYLFIYKYSKYTTSHTQRRQFRLNINKIGTEFIKSYLYHLKLSDCKSDNCEFYPTSVLYKGKAWCCVPALKTQRTMSGKLDGARGTKCLNDKIILFWRSSTAFDTSYAVVISNTGGK